MRGCEMCNERGKNWSGDDPKCAFYNHEFITDNWNCATMNELRRLIHSRGYKYRDDNAAATIGVLHVGEVERVNIEDRETVLDGGFYIVLTWYKERGRVGRGVVMSDDAEPRTLKLEDARTAFAYYNEQAQRYYRELADLRARLTRAGRLLDVVAESQIFVQPEFEQARPRRGRKE